MDLAKTRKWRRWKHCFRWYIYMYISDRKSVSTFDFSSTSVWSCLFRSAVKLKNESVETRAFFDNYSFLLLQKIIWRYIYIYRSSISISKSSEWFVSCETTWTWGWGILFFSAHKRYQYQEDRLLIIKLFLVCRDIENWCRHVLLHLRIIQKSYQLSDRNSIYIPSSIVSRYIEDTWGFS